MRVITERDLIKGVSEAWDSQYERHRGDAEWADKFVISDALHKLDLDTASAKTVDTVIGNSSWTAIKCNACNRGCKKAVVFETDEDTEFTLCIKCLSKANKALVSK